MIKPIAIAALVLFVVVVVIGIDGEKTACESRGGVLVKGVIMMECVRPMGDEE